MTRTAVKSSPLSQFWQGILDTFEVAVAIGYHAPWTTPSATTRDDRQCA